MWLHMIMIVVKGSSLVAILAQWIASMVDLYFGECVIPTPIHFEDFASSDELKIMLRLCGEVVLCELCWACEW